MSDHSLIEKGFINLGKAKFDQVLPLARRQRVEGARGALQLWRQRGRAFAAAQSDRCPLHDGLLNVYFYGLAVDRGAESEKVHRVFCGNRKVGVSIIERHIRHGKSHKVGYRLIAVVEEMIGNAD